MTSGFSLRTARYSRMRSLAFSRPEWSASRTSLVCGRSITSSVRFVPRQRDQPVEVGARHRVLGRGDRHLRQPVELAQRFLLDRLGHAGRFDLLAQLLDLLGLVVAFAELLLDRLHLLAQEVLALVLADLGLHLRLDLRAELEHLELLDQDPVQAVHPRADVERLEHLLLDRRADGRQARGDEVGEPARLGDVGGQRLQVVGQQRRQRHDLLEVGLDVAQQRVDLEAVGVVERLRRPRSTRARRYGLGRDDLVERQPRQALDDQPQAAVGQLEHLVDVGGGADRDRDRPGCGSSTDGVALGEDARSACRSAIASSIRRTELSRATASGMNEFGKQDRVAQRQDRQLRRECDSGRSPVETSSTSRVSIAIAHGRPPCLARGWPRAEMLADGVDGSPAVRGCDAGLRHRRSRGPWDAG